MTKFASLFCIIIIAIVAIWIAKTKNDSYTIISATYSANAGDIIIHYPQLESTGIEKENEINRILYEVAVEAFLTRYDSANLSVASEYTITFQDRNVLSVIFSGEPYVYMAAHPTQACFAVNIDLANATIIPLQEYAPIVGWQDEFIGGEFNMTRGAIPSPLSQNSLEILLNRYNDYPIIYDDSSHLFDYFITSDGIGVIIYVGHAEGDYIVFSGKVK